MRPDCDKISNGEWCALKVASTVLEGESGVTPQPYLETYTNGDMKTTTDRRRCTATPIAKAWDLAKKLDNSEKLELMAMLIESVRPAMSTALLKPYTMEELHERIAQAETNIATERTVPHEESMRKWKEKIALKKQELEMVEAV